MSASNVEIAELKAHLKSRRIGLISCCNFFATPTRLAAGLGTKDYPFINIDDSPRFSGNPLKIGSPVPFHTGNGFGDQLFNNEIIASIPLLFQEFRRWSRQKSWPQRPG
jgi:hypothetical protein